jgi:hypothetical protein
MAVTPHGKDSKSKNVVYYVLGIAKFEHSEPNLSSLFYTSPPPHMTRRLGSVSLPDCGSLQRRNLTQLRWQLLWSQNNRGDDSQWKKQ